MNPPKGCPFNPRCRFATDTCRSEVPELKEYDRGGTPHFAACHYAGELAEA